MYTKSSIQNAPNKQLQVRYACGAAHLNCGVPKARPLVIETG
jgi:hypothetical protein